MKLKTLVYNLKGPALDWYCLYQERRLEERDRDPLTFEELEDAFREEFGKRESVQTIWETFIATRQTESMLEYNTTFERALRDVKRHLDITNAIIRVEYIRGLQPDIMEAVESKEPKTWEEARKFALYKDHAQILKKIQAEGDNSKQKNFDLAR